MKIKAIQIPHAQPAAESIWRGETIGKEKRFHRDGDSWPVTHTFDWGPNRNEDAADMMARHMLGAFDPRAIKYYKHFRSLVIDTLPPDWTLTWTQIRRYASFVVEYASLQYRLDLQSLLLQKFAAKYEGGDFITVMKLKGGSSGVN